MQAYPGGSRPDVVGDRESPAPRRRRDRPLHRTQQRQGVRVGYGQHRDLHDGRRFLDRVTLGVGGGALERRQWIARIERHVLHRPALYPVLHPVGTVGIDIALEVAVVSRIGIEDGADGAVLRRDLGLDAAPRSPVAGDHDPVLHADAAALELLVIRRDAVVHIDQFPRDISVGRIGVESRKPVLLDCRRRVLIQGGLAQLRRVSGRFQHLQLPDARRGKEHMVLVQPGLETPGTEAVHQPVGGLAVVGRTGVDGLGDQVAHPLLEVVRVHVGVEAGLEVELLSRGAGAEAQHGGSFLAGRRRERQKHRKEADGEAAPWGRWNGHVI